MPKILEFETSGTFKKLTKYLEKVKHGINKDILDKYGRQGVALLSQATPVDSGLTASSWYYEIEDKDGIVALRFCNSNIADGWCPVAILLQYGHATGTGGWVEGRDYINPVIRPLFEQLAQDCWREVRQV